MINPEMYRWLRHLSQNEDFREAVALTDRAIEEQYDMELVLRFIVFRTMPEEDLKNIGDVGDFLTDRATEIAQGGTFNYEREENAFNITFRLLRSQLGSNSFHKYDPAKDKFLGGFLVSAFEVVALGLGYSYENALEANLDLVEIVKHLWMNQQFTSKSGSGVSASSRIPNTVPLGRRAFQQ